MKDEDKTKEQIIKELAELRQRIGGLKKSGTERKLVEEELQQSMRDILLINSLNTAINRGASFQEILDILVKETSKILSCYGATVYILSEDKKYLVMQNIPFSKATVKKIEELIGMKIPVVRIPLKEGGLYLKALQSGKPELINDPDTIKGLIAECTENKMLKKIAPNIYGILGIRSVITVPLVSDGEAIGLLDISRSEPFTESDLHRLTVISGQVTAAVKRKHVEGVIHESEKRYRALFEKSPNSIVLVDKLGTIIDCNNLAEKLIEYSKEEITGKHFEELLTLDPKDLPKLKKSYENLLKGMEGEPFELEIIRKYGERRWISVISSLLMKDNEIIGFQIISSDITGRKNAEAKIEHLNAVLRAIRNINQLIAKEKDRDRLLHGACNNLIKTRGFKSTWIALIDESKKLVVSAECGFGEDFLLILEKLKRSELVYCVRKALTKPEVLTIENPQSICTDCPLLAKCGGVGRMIVRLEHGRKVYGVLSVSPPENFIIGKEDKELFKEVAGDIAFALHGIELEEERKKAEEVLKESEKRYRYLFEHNQAINILVGMNGKIIEVNEPAINALGYDKSEVIGKDALEFVVFGHRKKAAENLVKDFRGEYTPPIEFDLIAKQGVRTFLFSEGRALLVEKGKPIGILLSAIDITDRKKAEEALQATNERLKYLLASTSVAIYTSKTSGDYGATTITENVKQIVGYELQEFIENSSFWVDHIHPEDRQRILNDIQRLFEQGKYAYEYRFLHKDGTYRWLRDEMNLVRDEVGNPVEIVGYWIDITERKKTEEALKESEEKYRKIAENPIDGVGMAQNGKIIYVNDAYCKIFGYKKDELIGESLLKVVAPEDKSLIEERAKDRFKGRKIPDTYVFKGVKKDGTGLFIEMSSSKPFIYKDKPTILAILRDITVRKRAEEELQRYKTLVSTANALIIAYDNDWRVTLMNPYACNVLGYKEGEMLGKDIREMIEESELERVEKIRQDIKINPDINVQGFEQYYWKQGKKEKALISWNVAAIRDSDGNVTGIQEVGHDITEHKRAEEALKESEERFRNLAEQSPNMIFINRKGRVVYANKKCEEVMGYEREEFYSPDFDFLTLIAPEHTDLMRAQFMRHMEGEEAPPNEFVLITKEGKSIDAIITTKLIAYKGENDILGIVTDITELKKAENKLKQTAEELARSNAEMEELMHSVAHDLRSPLRAMRGFSDALLEDYAGKMDAVAQDYTHRIVAAANRMDTLIQDLLDYSRLGHVEMELKPVKLEAIVKDAIAEWEPRIKEKEAIVTVENPLPDVVGNPDILSQVIGNLLSNAVKFVAPEVKPRVRIWAEKRKGRICLWVEDNGIGIAPEYHERIFRIFERLHSVDEYQGTGIGLAIVHKGVERMGGKVGVESALGQGSKFWIELPKVKKK